MSAVQPRRGPSDDQADSGRGQHPAARTGRWEARYVGADGRSHGVYGRTRRDASDRLREALDHVRQGVKPVSLELTRATT